MKNTTTSSDGYAGRTTEVTVVPDVNRSAEVRAELLGKISRDHER
jgi:hypothetical protein